MRHEEILRVSAIVHRQTGPFGRLTKLLMPRHAVVTLAASPSAVHGNHIAVADGLHVGPGSRHNARILMAEDQWHSWQDLDLTIDHVDVAMAEARALDSDEHFARTWLRCRHLLDDQPLTVGMDPRGSHSSSVHKSSATSVGVRLPSSAVRQECAESGRSRARSVPSPGLGCRTNGYTLTTNYH
jgi:hypothetical protein